MAYKNIFKIKDRKRFLREMTESKKKNAEDNLKFVRWQALWLQRKSNKDWSKRQKMILDQIYRSKRHRHIKLATWLPPE